MAKSTVSTSDNLKKQQYEEKLFRDMPKESFFMGRMAGVEVAKEGVIKGNLSGNGPNNILQIKTNVEKDKGDNIRFGMKSRLTGAFIENGQMEGNEQRLTVYNDSVTINKWRVGVRDEGEIHRKRPVYDLEEEMRTAILVNGAENIDAKIFDALLSNETLVAVNNSTFRYTTKAAAKAAVAAANKITPAFISKLRTFARTGNDRTFPPIRPVRIDGSDMFVMVVHNDALYDLKTDSTFAQARREAESRGKDNPLFRNATAVWDDVVIFEHENVTIGTDGGGAAVKYSEGAFMGAQALCFAFGRRPRLVKKDFDYEDEIGMDFSLLAGVDKPSFNSYDYGVINLMLARTQISDLS